VYTSEGECIKVDLGQQQQQPAKCSRRHHVHQLGCQRETRRGYESSECRCAWSSTLPAVINTALVRPAVTMQYNVIFLHVLNSRLLASSIYYTFCSVLQPSSIRGLATPWTYFLHLSPSSVILIDSSMGSPVHVLMLSIQAVRGLPRLRAPGIVPCIISFSRQLPCFLMV